MVHFPPDLALRIRTAATMRERDPLAYWQHMSAESVMACENLDKAELFLRWPNWSGKTALGAAIVVSLCQGRDSLGGVRLPKVRKPAAAVFSLDYPQQLFSVQPAYLAALGDYPHKATYKGDGILSTLRVRPLVAGGDDPAKWPLITFVSQENRKSGTGWRVPIAHFDEPPFMDILREIRKGARYGDDFMVRIITATPLVRRQWAPLKEDYEGCYNRINRGRMEIHMPDVRHSRIVCPGWPRETTSPKYRELLDLYRGDPLIDARLTAAYVDVTGDSPFRGLEHVLDAMEAACRTPEPVEWKVTREVDGADGRSKVMQKVNVEVYGHYRAGMRCYIPMDPSLGIESERHDPAGLLVLDADTGDLLARYNGYIGAYGLGTLAAGLARQYGNALVDPEVTGGYGGPCLTALADAGYGNIAQQRKETQPGRWETQLGFRTTAETRPAMFSALQEWLRSWDAGHRYAACPSAAVIRSLKDLTLDENGKPLAAPGLHDEDAILLGQALRKLNPGKRRAPPPPKPQPVVQTAAQFNAARRGVASPRPGPVRVRVR